MVITTFTPEWKLWIWSNIVNGYDKESIFNVLLNNGFDYNLIKRELEIEPTNTLATLPLKLLIFKSAPLSF